METLIAPKPDSVQQIMSNFYDLAIDHAIATVRDAYVTAPHGDMLKQTINPVLDIIIIRLQTLKK